MSGEQSPEEALVDTELAAIAKAFAGSAPIEVDAVTLGIGAIAARAGTGSAGNWAAGLLERRLLWP